MKRLLFLLCSLLTVSAAASLSFKLAAPDHSFEILFPGEPFHETQNSKSGRLQIVGHSYAWADSFSKFILTYIDISPSPPDTLNANDALNAALSGTINNIGGGTILSQQTRMVSGHATKNAKIKKGKMIVDARFVLDSPRVYQLLVLHDEGNTPPLTQQFFDSLVIKH